MAKIAWFNLIYYTTLQLDKIKNINFTYHFFILLINFLNKIFDNLFQTCDS